MFKDFPIRKLIKDRNKRNCVYWMNAFEFDLPIEKDISKLIELLYNQGFETRHFFSRLDTQPFLKGKVKTFTSLHESKLAERNGIYFPSSQLVTRSEVEQMAEIVQSFLK